MIRKIRTAHRTTGTSVVRITIRMKPLAAHVLKARVRSNGAALHTLDHQFSKSVPRKSPRRDADSSRVVGVSQGGQLFEFTPCRQGSKSDYFSICGRTCF